MPVDLLTDGEEIHAFDESVYAGYTVLARILGQSFPERSLRVTRQQVHMWSTRRIQNDFPQSYRVMAHSGKIKNLYKIHEVVSWYKNYVPNRGGRAKSTGVDNMAPVE